MNTKNILLILFVILTQALAACGTAAPADPAAIAQSFNQAVNDGDIEAAMALVAEDVQCRGVPYLSGKDSFRAYIQGSIDGGFRSEISDLVVEGDKVTYNWTAYNANGVFAARGVETLQIKDGLIILIESIPD